MNLTLIYPMFALVILTFIVLSILFISRVSAVRTKKISAKYFKTYEGGNPPEFITKASRHFSNLFEMPVLYYAGLILAMLVPVEGFWILFWSWSFVVARVVHALIHIGPNKLWPRIFSYFTGAVCVLAIWVLLVMQVAGF